MDERRCVACGAECDPETGECTDQRALLDALRPLMADALDRWQRKLDENRMLAERREEQARAELLRGLLAALDR